MRDEFVELGSMGVLRIEDLRNNSMSHPGPTRLSRSSLATPIWLPNRRPPSPFVFATVHKILTINAWTSGGVSPIVRIIRLAMPWMFQL